MTADVMQKRRAGVLLHPSSLPGAGYCGCFGEDARRFIDLVAQAGITIWQILPLGPTHVDGSPYQTYSVHAGRIDHIDPVWLQQRGWLDSEGVEACWRNPLARMDALRAAADAVLRDLTDNKTSELARAYREFLRDNADWLDDYVAFQVVHDLHGKIPWYEWPADYRDRAPQTMQALSDECGEDMDRLRACQFVFQRQWWELRAYAHQRGIALFGDMPMYVHLDSVDVWAHRDQFDLDEVGRARTVTGVPPDYFSATGQLWGNPQYDWDTMSADGFGWWLRRFRSASENFDIVRIDHFRALKAYWEIPAQASAATEGRWVEAPGKVLLEAVQSRWPDLRLVAENLGTIGPEVEALRAAFSLPGMIVMQFAFDGSPDNPYLPHNHVPGDIVYTGTHDNNTTLGWYDSLDDTVKTKVYAYFCDPGEPMPDLLVRQTLASVAYTAIIPWQDFLRLDGRHRMNTPATSSDNWKWRFRWEQVEPELPARIRGWLHDYNRLPG